MARIPIYIATVSEDGPIGHILWDGQQLSANPNDSPTLQSILDSPVAVGMDVVNPDEDPEAWFKALPRNYRGSYVMAGEVEET